MSRRYPVRRPCERCSLTVPHTRAGEPRSHKGPALDAALAALSSGGSPDQYVACAAGEDDPAEVTRRLRHRKPYRD